MKTFEEWLKKFESDGVQNLTQWDIRLSKNAYDTGFADGQFALNEDLGIAANEAAKDARRKVAVEKAVALVNTETMKLTDAEVLRLDAIVKEAQG